MYIRTYVLLKKKRMRDESDDLVTNTNSNIRKHTYVLVQKHVYIRTRMQMCEKIANTSKVSRMRLETQLVPREANVYVTIKQSNDSKK